MVVAVTPKHAGSCNRDRAASLLRPPLRGAPPSVPQQHGIQHVGCGCKHTRRGTNITDVMIRTGFLHPGVEEVLKILIEGSSWSISEVVLCLQNNPGHCSATLKQLKAAGSQRNSEQQPVTRDRCLLSPFSSVRHCSFLCFTRKSHQHFLY